MSVVDYSGYFFILVMHVTNISALLYFRTLQHFKNCIIIIITRAVEAFIF